MLIYSKGSEMMGEVIRLLADLTNDIHDVVEKILNVIGIELSDKTLHFILFGFLGILMFFIVNAVFKWISKWSISAISFIYTFTFLAVLALSVEIQQKITGRGNMEFNDIVAGLLGFLALIGIYVIVRGIIYYVKRFYKKSQKSEISE